jgi:hypothetical protein
LDTDRIEGRESGGKRWFFQHIFEPGVHVIGSPKRNEYRRNDFTIS